MKTISQVAIECGVNYERVYRTIKSIGLILDKSDAKRLNKYQEDLLHAALYFGEFCDTITLESKINTKETFNEFKNITYTR